MFAQTLRYMYPGIDLLNDMAAVDDGSGPKITAWYRPEPQPTEAEIEAAAPAALAAIAAEAVKRAESSTAKDDAKRALSQLDTITSGIDAATLAQAKTAIKTLADIQRNVILALLGR